MGKGEDGMVWKLGLGYAKRGKGDVTGRMMFERSWGEVYVPG